MAAFKVERLDTLTDESIVQLAAALHDSMRDLPKSYADLGACRDEVTLFRADDRLMIAAHRDGSLAGWIGAIKHSPNLWELHPLCVRPEFQRQGAGSALVAALEEEASASSVGVLWLGTEDETGATNLFGVDISADPLQHLCKLELIRSHPIAFYQRLGYNMCGVLPDASGAGMHDFLMCKRLSPHASGPRSQG